MKNFRIPPKAEIRPSYTDPTRRVVADWSKAEKPTYEQMESMLFMAKAELLRTAALELEVKQLRSELKSERLKYFESQKELRESKAMWEQHLRIEALIKSETDRMRHTPGPRPKTIRVKRA